MTLELAQLQDLDDYQVGDPEQLLTAAESTVRAYCGWHIAPSREDDTVTIVARRSAVVMLPTLYLTAVTALTENAIPLDLADFSASPAGFLTRVRWYGSAWEWTREPATLLVEFTHGYAEVPADIRSVVMALANRNVNSPGNLIRVGQVQYANGVDAFTDAEKSILDHYRLPVLS